MANNQIKIGVGFQIDKTGINELQNSLRQIQISASNATGADKMTKSLREAADTAKIVDAALEKAFNTNLGTTNLSKFNQELKKNNLTIDQVRTKFTQAGQAGQNAWNLLGSQILKTNVQLKQSNKLLDEMAESMSNTVKWGITSSIFNSITQSISKAYTYTKKLDSSLNDIRIVTDKSAESMAKFAKQANEAAKGLGASTLDYTEASLIYYQQGLSDADVQARTETTLKAANVTGQHADEVSEQLTAVWNGYKVSAQEAELYVDKLAAVAATTAADLEELSTGMSKVASAANSMGVDIDQLNAQLATIVSVTRQAPESVGTALKTIYARMSDLKLGGTDEDGLGLGDVSGQMEAMGIDVLDANGNLREMGNVIEDVAAKWNTWTEAQKTAMAQVMAGKRQYNNLVALFDNWGMYTDALNESANAAGTLQKQQDIYMESTEAHLQKLRTTAEELYDGLFDTGEVNILIDLLTDLTQVGSNFVNSFGGGFKSIGGILLVVANIFNKQLANGINNLIVNQQKMTSNAELLRQKAEQLKAVSQNQVNLHTLEGVKAAAIAEGYQKQAEYAQKIQDIQHNLSQEEYNRLNTLTAEVGELTEQITLLEKAAQFTAESSGLDITEDKMKQVFAGEENFDAEIEDIDTDIGNNQQQIEVETKTTQKLEQLIQKIKENKGQIVKEDVQIEGLTKAQSTHLSKVVQQVQHEQKTTKDLEKAVERIIKKNQDSIKVHQKENQELEKTKKKYKEIQQNAAEAQRLDAERKAKKSDLDEGLDIGQQSANVLKNVTQITSALSTMSMAWMSVNSLIDIWEDKSLSAGQKISQTLMTVGITLPMIISSFKSLNEVMGVQTGVFEAINALQTKNNVIKAAGLVLNKQELASLTSEVVITDRAAMVQALKNGNDAAAIGLLTGESAAILQKMTLTDADTIAVIKAKLAQDAWNTSILASPWTWIIAGIATLVGVYALLSNAIETNEEKAERMAEQEKQLQEAYNQTAEAYNNLINNITQYQNAESALNKLTKGTTEWRQAVFDLNQQVLELIRTYPELGNIVSNVDGQLILDTDSKEYDDFLKQQEKQQQASYRLSLQGSQVSDVADYDASITNATDYFNMGATDYGYSTDDPIFGGLSDENLKGIVEAVAADSALLKDEKAFTKMLLDNDYVGNRKIEDEYGNTIIESYSVKQVQALFAEGEKLLELADTLNQNQATNDVYASQRYDSKLRTETTINGKDFEEYEYGDLMVQGAANIANSQEIKDFTVEEKKRIEDTTDPDSRKKQYQELTGISDEEYAKLDDDTVIEGLLSAAVENKVLEILNPQNFANTIAQIETSDVGKDVLDVLNRDINSFSPEQIVNLANSESLDGLFNKYKDTFNSMGYDSAEALIKAYEEKIKSYDVTTYWDSQAEKVKAKLDVVNESLSKMQNGEDLTEEEIQKLEQSFPELAKIADKSSHAYLDALEKIQESHEKIYSESLAEGLKATYTEAQNALKEYNEVAEENSEEQIEKLKTLKNLMLEIYDKEYKLEVAEVDDLLTDVDKLISKADGLQIAFESIGDGFKVAADKSEELFNIFPELAKNAQVLADGTIKLDEEVVGAVIGHNGEIINSDKEVLAQAIQNKIDEIDIKEAQLKAEIERVEGMTALEFQQAGIVQELAKEQASTEVIIDEKKTSDIVANDGNATKAIIENWAKKLDAAKKYAEAVAKAVAGEDISGFSISADDFGINTEVQTQNTVDEVDTETDEALLEQMRQDWLNAHYNELEMEQQNRANLVIGLGKVNYETTTGFTKAMEGSSKDKKEDEIDRYWELNKALETITETISDLDKIQSHLHGKELINSLEKENELLEQQAEKYRAINAEQLREASELRGKLANYGVSFDANGGIANYAAAMNQMINMYNSNLGNEAAEKKYEDFKKLLERYEALFYKEMIDTQNQLDDIFYQQLENNLQAWETDLEINLDLEEAEREWSDFTKAMSDDFKAVYRDIDKDFKNITEKMATYGEGGTINLDIQAIQDVVREIEKLESGGVSDMFASVSEAQEKLKELQGTLMDDAEAAHDLWVEAWEAYLEGIDQAADKFEDLMDKFESINDELEFQRELTELLYGDQAYGIYANIYASQINNSMAQINSIKEQIGLWEKLYSQAEEGSEEQLKYYELMKDAQSELNDMTLEHIKLLKDERDNLIDEIINTLDKSLTGNLGIDKVKEDWEDAKWYADKYFDSTERLYELESIANKYNEAISNASTLESQQKLKELMDGQLADLESKEKLTEYDITLAEKRLSIAQAEMALQDAQNAKNSMKLVRGANGNWEYQYVADENDIANKQQQLLDSYKGLYDYVKSTEEKAMESIIDMSSQFYKDLAELKEKLGEDTEEFAIAAEELYNEYYNPEYGKISILMKEHTQYEKDLNIANAEVLWGIYQNDVTKYKEMTDQEKAIIDNFKNHSIADYIELHTHIDNTYTEIQAKLEETTENSLQTWNSAAHDMAAAWNADDGESVRAQVQEAISQIIQANEDYKIKVDEVANAVGKDFSEEGIKGSIDAATVATNALRDATSELCAIAIEQLTGYKSAVGEIEAAWLAVYNQASEALRISKEAAAAANVQINSSINSNDSTGIKTSNSKDGEGDSPPPDGKIKTATVTIHTRADGEGTSKSLELKKGGFEITHDKKAQNVFKFPYYYYVKDTETGKGSGYISESDANKLNSLDTGGYTGEWAGGDGRLAMLHSKELVLNKTDTKNILDTVNTIRDLGSVTSSIGSAIVSNIKAMLMDIMGIKAGVNYHTQNADVSTNNTFEIHAEFPNANDVTSIREAILSLPNLASQYISQNKK